MAYPVQGHRASLPRRTCSLLQMAHSLMSTVGCFSVQFDPLDNARVIVGNMTRGVDVFDATTGQLLVTMRSDNLTAVPTRSAVHPVRNWVVSSTASGRLYLWQ